MFIVIGWIVLAAIVGALAAGRGQSGWGMFFVSLLLSPLIGFLIVLAMKDRKAEAAADKRAAMIAQAARPAVETDTKPCPRCAETIKTAATACRFCGVELG
jgi:Zn-dependent protease with chaperone function